jgi:GAF domain-containing protein
LLHDGIAIGSIGLRRANAQLFSEAQVALLETFAHQAVITIENTRLFEAEQASQRELQESFDYQTATSDVQPIFDMIATSAARLCKAQLCHVFRYDGELIHFAAAHGLPSEARELMRVRANTSPGRHFAAGRAILNNAIAEIADIYADPDYDGDIGRMANFRSALAVPMQRDGRPIRAIALARAEIGRFPERQIELLRTFADQAVIAIENTRLFEEVQARTKELQESLKRQTATSEVLGGDFALTPTRCNRSWIRSWRRRGGCAERAVIWRLEGETFRAVAHHGQPEERVESVYSARGPVSRGNMVGRANLRDGRSRSRMSPPIPSWSRMPSIGQAMSTPF